MQHRIEGGRRDALCRGVNGVAAMLAMLCLLAVADAAAAMRRIDPGEAPRLKPDEGLVVLAVDANAQISSIRVDHAGGGNAEVLNYLGQGRTLGLYAAAAGEYEWARINVTGWNVRTRFDLKGENYRFEVIAGQISYPGELVMRPLGWTSARIHVANHGLPAIDWLERNHPGPYRQYRFAYAGHYPDPFPEFYRAARADDERPPAELDSGREPPKPASLPVDAETMWRPGRIGDYSLSPSGRLFAEAVRDDDGDWSLRLLDLQTGGEQTLLTRRRAPGMVVWKDDFTLVVEEPGNSYSHVVYRVALGGADGAHRVQRVPIIGKGRVVDLLPDDPEAILFEGYDSHRQLAVHRVVLRGDRDIRGFATAKTRDRLNKGVERDIAWFADGHGRLRAAVALRDEEAVLLYGRDGVYEEVLRPRPEGGFEPAGLSFDGATIYGFSDEGRPQRELVAFDPVRRQVVRTLFSKEGIDIVGLVVDERREPVAARYYLSGQLVTEYFAESGQALERQLREAFPGQTVAVVDRSDDGRQLILWVDGSDRPARLYHLDVAAGRAALLEESAPWLDGLAFAPTRVLRVDSTDGLPVEAFLTLPAGAGDKPLVVFPHGGPIGVSDRRHFDREVQFLALQGFAVLQVNFRGSEGYGRAFREAGMGSYGTRIEDDIEAALQAALAAHPVDGKRVCMLGSSYGGYSALISAIRWPDRFRCAVSISGVSDRPLFFTASDSVRDASLRPLMERMMGDPRTQLEQMKAASPLYRVDELRVPLMLVHGREDDRVDFEHTRRLVRMLNLRGRPPVVLAFPRMGHGFTDPVAIDIAWTGIAGFLQQHLGPVTAAAGAGGGRDDMATDAGAGGGSIGKP